MKTMIRKLSIPIVIFSVSLMTVPIGAAEGTASGKMSGVITTEKGGSVNIRAGDVVDSEVIGKAKTGETVHILGTSGEWYKVDLGNDKVGYIRKDYVKLGAEDAGDKATDKDTDTGDSQDKDGETGVVTGTSVNIRAGKGTDSKAVGKAKKGDKLHVLDSSGEWYKVELDDGKVGYVLGSYLKLGATDATKEDASAAKAGSDTEETGVVVTKTGELNIRAGMSKDDKIVGTAKKGSKIHVLKKTGEWYKVQLDDGTTGYANRSYIKLGGEEADSEATSASKSDKKESATKAGEKTDTDTKKPVKEDTLKGEGVVSTKGSPANVRASGSLKAEVVAKVDKGAKVQVVAKAGDWYKVELDDGTKGYVQRNLIKLGGSSKTLLSLPADSGKATLSKLEKAATGGGEGEVVTQGSPLNVRTDKSTEAKVVGKVAKGSKIRILGKEGEWYKVQLKNGKTGYASSQFIQPGATNQETAGAATESGKGNLGKGDSGTVVTKGSPLNIRSGKSQSAEVVTKAAKGSKVQILEDAGEWYKIELEDGTTGYAKREFIK